MPDQPMTRRPPAATGLYDPRDERDACGVGFVVDIKGRRSHSVVEKGLQVLINLLHRGACGCEADTGGGAGVLIQTPDRFLRKVTAELGITLPPAGQYGTGLVFLPRLAAEREQLRTLVERIVGEEGQRVLAWRLVPTADAGIGESAIATKPVIEQLFIAADAVRPEPDPAGMSQGPTSFERKLYVIRKRIEHEADRLRLAEGHAFYIPSLSSQTLIYKGMLIADQIEGTFPDLVDPDVESALALQHQHVPVVAARASVPLHRAQRRDQHAARQHQLDARARGAAAIGPARRRSAEDPADHPRGRQRYGDVRQRPRVPGDDRAVARARDPDDDPGALGRSRE